MARPRQNGNKARGRHDPRRRSHDGAPRWARILNADPARHYVMVNMNDAIQGPAFYEGMGYRIERPSKDGPRLAGFTVPDGADTIEGQGNILMSIGKQQHLEIQKTGAFGDSGQELADQIEEMILDRRGDDPLRGLNASKYLGVENDIEEPTLELGT